MRDALLRAFLVIGDISAACAWTWPGVFPKADPVAVLVRYHTPNVYAAVVAWYYVAPGVAVFLTGQFLISTSRIWFARMGVSLGLRLRQRGGTGRERPPPIFDRWRGQPMRGVWHQVWHTPPTGWGSLPSQFILTGRLPGPRAGRTISHTERPDA